MKKYIALINNCIIRNAQVFYGPDKDYENADSSNLWRKDTTHRFYCGVYSGTCEREVMERVAKAEGVDPIFIELMEI